MYEIFEKLLAKSGITTYKFCKEAGVNASTISTWKKNNSLARPELAKKVCDYFDIPLDYLMGNSFIEEMGHIVQEERIDQGITQEELATKSGISVEDLNLYESEDEPIREDIFEDITKALGTSHLELLYKYDLYDEYIPPQFNGDVLRFEAFKKACARDAMFDRTDPDDVLLISRAARKMTPENRKKLIDMAKIMFAEDFDD